jgi:hypothetical protein
MSNDTTKNLQSARQNGHEAQLFVGGDPSMLMADGPGKHTKPTANTGCPLCGRAMPDLPIADGDYFNVIMRVGRPIKRGARLRRGG